MLFAKLIDSQLCQGEEKEGRRCLTRSRSHFLTRNVRTMSHARLLQQTLFTGFCLTTEQMTNNCSLWLELSRPHSAPTHEHKIAGYKKCRGPGPGLGVMMAPAPASQAGPGRDVNDQIMSATFTGRAAGEGGREETISDYWTFGWPREQSQFLSQTFHPTTVCSAFPAKSF